MKGIFSAIMVSV